jgi:hypothetical protein
MVYAISQFHSEDGGAMFLLNVGRLVADYMGSITQNPTI